MLSWWCPVVLGRNRLLPALFLTDRRHLSNKFVTAERTVNDNFFIRPVSVMSYYNSLSLYGFNNPEEFDLTR